MRPLRTGKRLERMETMPLPSSRACAGSWTPSNGQPGIFVALTNVGCRGDSRNLSGEKDTSPLGDINLAPLKRSGSVRLIFF